jgi:regulation of enolase protein 1 (concanavalin A-like superfamily)
MKDIFHSKWSMTDLGEPAKIVGNKITCGETAIRISQEKNIENILKHERMEYANPVAMPMDPND